MDKLKLKKYQNINSEFSDYSKFNEPSLHRNLAKNNFVNNLDYAPKFRYPAIESLFDRATVDNESNDDEYLFVKKNRIQQVIYELEQYSSEFPETDLYTEYFLVRLKRIMLTEASFHMIHSNNEDSRAIAAREFTNIGQELYGPLDKKLFNGLLYKCKKQIEDYVPKTTQAESIKQYLEQLFVDFPEELTAPLPIIDEKTLQEIGKVVRQRYKKMLNVFPDTDETIYYDAQQSVNILNDALDASGLKKFGWKVIIDERTQIPSTDGENRAVKIPNSLNRNSNELKRLAIHEIEVHARRYENGVKKSKILSLGTANYADVEEGIGLLLESSLGGSIESPALDRATERYLLAGIATGYFGPLRDARQSHEVLWRILAIKKNTDGFISAEDVLTAKKLSANHIENAFRGTPATIPGVIFPKLKIYLEGLVKNCRMFQDYKGDYNKLLDNVMLGKYDHTNEKECELVNKYLLSK